METRMKVNLRNHLNTHRIVSAGLALLMAGSLLVFPTTSRASEEGRRNTALALGAVSAYLFTRGGNKLPAFATAAGAVYAYKRYDDAVKARHNRERYGYYDSRYNRQYDGRYIRQDNRWNYDHAAYYRQHRNDNRSRERYVRYERHDNGLHKGWYKGKHNGQEKCRRR